jgi:hypothetical protein
VLATSFSVFALLLAALLLPAFQSLQLYADLPYCPNDRALRRHIHLIPSTIVSTFVHSKQLSINRILCTTSENALEIQLK